MSCNACGSENPPDSAFCEGCGAKLESACPACGAEVGASARFCRKCGGALNPSSPSVAAGFKPASGAVEYGTAEHAGQRPAATGSRSPSAYTPKHLADKILQSKSALEGERKQVTVLFADVKGSMELAEQLDPEQWHAILDRFFAILTDGVHRFEGTVNQYTGDGIMALFGAPIAHEDEISSAIAASFVGDLQREVSSPRCPSRSRTEVSARCRPRSTSASRQRCSRPGLE